MNDDPVCPNCGDATAFSPTVSVVLVFAPALERPYPLIPSEGYRFCIGPCNAIFRFVSKAVEAHPATREAMVGSWQRAVVVYDDGEGAEVHPNRPQQATA